MRAAKHWTQFIYPATMRLKVTVIGLNYWILPKDMVYDLNASSTSTTTGLTFAYIAWKSFV